MEELHGNGLVDGLLRVAVAQRGKSCEREHGAQALAPAFEGVADGVVELGGNRGVGEVLYGLFDDVGEVVGVELHGR